MLIHILVSGIFLFLLQFADTQHGKLLNLFKTKNLFLSFALEQYSYNDNRKKKERKKWTKEQIMRNLFARQMVLSAVLWQHFRVTGFIYQQEQ